MVLLLRKLYLYFTKDPKAVHYFPGAGGGCPTFSRGGGVQMLISIETHIRTFIYQGECPDPLSPLDPHMGNVIIRDNIYHSPASNHNCQALIYQYL